MVYRLGLLLVGLAIFLPCTSAKPDKLPSQREEESVTVVAEPKFYVIGVLRADEMELFKKPDRERMLEVDGFIFEVIRPPEYAGRIIGMHHDGVLASGNPYALWVIGRRYEFKIPKNNIGQLSFRPCSVHGKRKELPK